MTGNHSQTSQGPERYVSSGIVDDNYSMNEYDLCDNYTTAAKINVMFSLKPHDYVYIFSIILNISRFVQRGILP